MCALSRGNKITGIIIILYMYTVVHNTLLTTLSIHVHVKIVFFLRIIDLSDNADVDLVKCRAYEVVKFSRQGITMNENPAYGEIGVRVHSVLS